MNLINKVRIMHFFMCIGMVFHLHGGDFLKQFVKPGTEQSFFVGVIEEKQKLLNELKKERAELDVSYKVLLEKVLRQIDEVKTLLASVESKLQKKPDDELLIKQQSLL